MSTTFLGSPLFLVIVLVIWFKLILTDDILNQYCIQILAPPYIWLWHICCEPCPFILVSIFEMSTFNTYNHFQRSTVQCDNLILLLHLYLWNSSTFQGKNTIFLTLMQSLSFGKKHFSIQKNPKMLSRLQCIQKSEVIFPPPFFCNTYFELSDQNYFYKVIYADIRVNM